MRICIYYLLSVLLVLPSFAVAEEQSKVFDDFAGEMLETIDPNVKVAIQPFNSKKVDLPDKITTGFNNRLVDSLLKKSDFKINIIERAKLEDIWQEAEEFGNADFDKLVKEAGAEILIIGDLRLRKGGVEISYRGYDLRQGQRGKIIASTRTKNLDFDLAEETFQMKKDYQDYLEKFIAAKPNDPSFNVKVRTNKKNTNNQDEYQIGEMVTFFISVEEDCFLTLLDINPGGEITVLFPNKYQKNNFVRAGKTIQIPPKDKKFDLKVNPPHGEERLKTIATLDRDFPVNFNLNSRDGFHVIKPETSRGMREIEALANFFSSKQNSGWSQDYLKIFIHKKNNIFSRGQRTIPSMSEIFGNK